LVKYNQFENYLNFAYTKTVLGFIHANYTHKGFFMNSFKKAFALFLLVTIFSQSLHAEESAVRTWGLASAGLGVTIGATIILKSILEKILEENPAVDERTVYQKIHAFLRYGFGFSVAALGAYIGLVTLANANNPDFYKTHKFIT
jgi:hypothetical protein